jgi:ribosomal protein S18 acetylase RimI-like enzyme
MKILPLEPGRYKETALMLARAFYDDPMWMFLEPDPAKRMKSCAWVQERWARLVAPLRASWVAEEDGVITGAALWFPPGKYGVSASQIRRAGFLRMPVDLGVRWTAWARPIFNEGVQHQEALMKEPYWVLDVLGVDPARQRSGVGRALISKGLALADEEKIPSFVVTHKERNVIYYQQFGFVLIDQYVVRGNGPIAYSLRRPAADTTDPTDRTEK